MTISLRRVVLKADTAIWNPIWNYSRYAFPLHRTLLVITVTPSPPPILRVLLFAFKFSFHLIGINLFTRCFRPGWSRIVGVWQGKSLATGSINGNGLHSGISLLNWLTFRNFNLSTSARSVKEQTFDNLDLIVCYINWVFDHIIDC